MAHRLFTDSDGTDWLVLAVYPRSEERRSRADRRSGEHPLFDAEPRRVAVRRKTVRRSMESGWLVFKTAGARRRFTPIMENWETCSILDLQKLLHRATPSRRSSDPTRS
jgi:hypothetical protein